MLLSHPQHTLFLLVSMPTGPPAFVCSQHRSRHFLSANLRRPAPQPSPTSHCLSAWFLGRSDDAHGAPILTSGSTVIVGDPGEDSPRPQPGFVWLCQSTDRPMRACYARALFAPSSFREPSPPEPLLGRHDARHRHRSADISPSLLSEELIDTSCAKLAPIGSVRKDGRIPASAAH